MNIERIDKLVERMFHHGLDCVAIVPGPTMIYLTGLDFHLSERPIVAFFPKTGKPTLVVPKFEAGQVQDFPWHVFAWTDEDGVEGAIEACCQSLDLSGKRLGVEELVMRVKEYNLLKIFAPEVVISLADPLITELRLVKDANEIDCIRKAVHLTEIVLEETLPKIKIGMTEKDIESELVIGLFKGGSEALPFKPLVQTGTSGANPHATSGNRQLAEGDLLIIDFGARVDGYISDITRTYAVGAISEEKRQLYNIVKESNQAGCRIAKAGISCQAVDQATRAVIDSAGYGKYFTHRTGHGIGLEAHEPPFIVDGNPMILQTGMTFTVEPGIYIPSLGGVRIEDDVLITEDGTECLTTFSRELITVACST